MKKVLVLFFSVFVAPILMYAQNGTHTVDTLSNNQISLSVPRHGRGQVVQKLDSLQTQMDTMQQSINALFEIYKNTEIIAENTEEDNVRDGWNVYGWVAFAIALLSLGVAAITYREQKKTEEHTTNAPVEVQQWKLRDLPRHFYRNLVCTCAIVLKYRAEGEEKKRNNYPSESNLRKLQTLPDDIVLPIDIDKKKDAEQNAYKYMHELRLLLRNYNIEVEVASGHLTRKTISDESLKQDFDNLLFKPIQLTKSTFDFEKALPKSDEKHLTVRTIYSVLNEHFKKLKIAANFNLLYSSYAPDYLDALLADNCSLFDDRIDKKSGVERSVDNLLGYGFENEKGKEAYRGITISEKDEKKYEAIISREEAIKEFGKLNDFVTILSSIKDEKIFASFYKAFYLRKEKEMSEEQLSSAYETYSHLKPYFDYLGKETWEFHTLLKYILTVDAIIEIDRIGMVNYA